ncbi:conserved hypothetical protein [Xenorhabdus bovienii str. puntauvense]|uniref:Uncharacterized protein n=1 Tax=Xenorhabdus bovienii str. puntauvense TaxID=1398201 RepID=A0A077N7I3_XENBV|nr:conserved hypothetical protein [Xenorhabdus bovienii str. puntauvense]
MSNMISCNGVIILDTSQGVGAYLLALKSFTWRQLLAILAVITTIILYLMRISEYDTYH